MEIKKEYIDEILSDIEYLKKQKSEYEERISKIETKLNNTKTSILNDPKYSDTITDIKNLIDRSKKLYINDNSIHSMNKELYNMIQKSLNKLISKTTPTDITYIHSGYWGKSETKLVLYSRGFANYPSGMYYSQRANRIENLYTLYTILKDTPTVNKIKKLLHKPDKIKLLEILNKHLSNMEVINTDRVSNSNEKSIEIPDYLYKNKTIYHIIKKGSYYSDKWNFDIQNITVTKMEYQVSSRYYNGGYIPYPELRVYYDYKDNYNNSKSTYENIQLTDVSENEYLLVSQLWDIIKPIVTKELNKLESISKSYKEKLQSLWSDLSPYIIADCI